MFQARSKKTNSFLYYYVTTLKGDEYMNADRDLSILNIEVKLRTGVYQGDLAEDLKINIDNLSESYIDQPGKYAWWASLAAQARAIADKIKAEVDNKEDYVRKSLRGELDAKVRKGLELDGEKITETKVENAIYSHPAYREGMEELQDLRIKYAQANENAVLLESARAALDQRKDMLISLGAQLRSDYNNTSISIKKENAKQVLAASKGK